MDSSKKQNVSLRPFFIFFFIFWAAVLPIFEFFMNPFFGWGWVIFFEAFLIAIVILIIRNKPIPQKAPTVDSTQQPTPTVKEVMLPKASYTGVAGWLLLFCISLTILQPLGFLWQIIYLLIESSKLANKEAPLFTIVVLVGMIFFSLFAGILLWLEEPKGPKWAKIYLIVYWIVSLFYFLDFTLTGRKLLPDSLLFGVFFVFSLKFLIVPTAYSTIWYIYLIRSKRVRATY